MTIHVPQLARPAPSDRDARAAALRAAHFGAKYCGENPFHDFPDLGKDHWRKVVDVVDSWLAYERQLSEAAIALKLRAERARALDEVHAAAANEMLSEPQDDSDRAYDRACRDVMEAIRALCGRSGAAEVNTTGGLCECGCGKPSPRRWVGISADGGQS